jgi:hypothetical protein
MGGVTIPMIVAQARGQPPKGKTMLVLLGRGAQGEDS